MNAKTLAVAAMALGLPASAASTLPTFDVFNAEGDVPPNPAGPLRGGAPCDFGPLSRPLALADAVERALCDHPKTAQAWAQIKQQAAAKGAAEGAFLPTVTVSGQDLRDESRTSVKRQPVLNSSNIATSTATSANLSWVLYDFGGRGAALDAASELLAAALASHQATLQTVFAAAATDYYAAQAAQGAWAAAREIEQTAKNSFDVATRRVEKGAAPLSDALQAQTAYVQASVGRAKAAGDWQAALGTLAADMLLPSDTPIVMPDVETGVAPDHDFQQSVSALIDQAERRHPSIRAAEAQLRAAEADVEKTEAAGLPSISLVGKASRSNQPVNEGLGLPYYRATATDKYIGMQVNVPLFEGFTRNYQVREAEAKAQEQKFALDDARRQVGLDVWISYQKLQAATENLLNSAALLAIARDSYKVAEHRYEVGVGSMVELLNAQSTLTDARRQRIQSLTDWRTGRLQLAGKLGELDLRQVEGE